MHQFRQFIITTVEYFLILIIVVMTISFAFSAYQWGGVIGFLIGGIAGFVFSAVIAATIFLLAEIAENTRGGRSG